MSLRTIGVSVTLACLMILPVAAEESGRYQLERSESGFARLDTVTGANEPVSRDARRTSLRSRPR